MKEKLLNVAVVVSMLCAVVVTGLLVRREFFPPAPAGAEPPKPERVEGWREYGKPGLVLYPAPNAPVRIVEFSDYQCPFCARFEESLDSIQARYPGQVEVVFRHYPIEAIHSDARMAAVAAECAADQGRFEPYHRALFSAQREIGITSWTEFARRAAVPDTVALQKCMAGGSKQARVNEDIQSGKRLGVDGTPTVLINQWRVKGALPLASLDSLVASLLPSGTSRR